MVASTATPATADRLRTITLKPLTVQERNEHVVCESSTSIHNVTRPQHFSDASDVDENNCPRIQAISFMAVASAVHFAGFEFARSGTIALFTSTKTGFVTPSASPISTICMTPFSLVVLWLYTKSLERWGPRKSLMFSTIMFAWLVASSAFVLSNLETLIDESHAHCHLWKKLAQATVFSLNVAQSSFVQLLYTQHWSFIGSISKEWEGASMWFAPIAGLGSLASTMAALGVQPVVQRFGLTGSLWASSIFLLASGIAADKAYRIALRHDFEPYSCQNKQQTLKRKRHFRKASPSHSGSLLAMSLRLFHRVPVLANLCIEVLTCQSVSSIINFLFLLAVKECIPDDHHRASWTATWYARINFFSGILQFFVLPLVLRYFERNYHNNKHQQRRLWLLMPVTMMMCATLMTYQAEDLSLFLVTATFALYKTLEYSVRGVAVEMVYVNLDYESRFFGKEVIGLFVERIGKSGTAVILSLVSWTFGNSAMLDKAFVQALSLASLLWLFASYPLAHPTGKEKLQ